MINKKSSLASESNQTKDQIHTLITKIDAAPTETDNYLKLATILIGKGSFEQAVQLLEQAKKLVQNPQDLDYDLAVGYYMQGNFKHALELLNHIPNDDLVLYQKALVMQKVGQHQKALAYALTIKQLDDRVYELLGDIWLSLGQLAEAQANYEKIYPTKRGAKINFLLGITVLERNRDLAEKYFSQAKEEDYQFYQSAQKQYNAILKMLSDVEKDND